MRYLQVRVRREKAPRVVELAREHGAISPLELAGSDGAGEAGTVLVTLPNDRVGEFIARVAEEVDDAGFLLLPSGVLPVHVPLSEMRSKVADVAPLSTMEMVLAALQSVGTWRGMLLYALFSGAVAAYGVMFDATFLLVGAMLIAPMGAPALVAVVGVAIGDPKMVGRGALRFGAAVGVLVLSAALLGFAYGMEMPTATMELVTSISGWAVLVALVAGGAGAQSQVESDRESLVSGAATGFLVAAALSPTSAVLGLSIVLGRWDYVATMAFQILLQFSAIVTGGWLTLAVYGVNPAKPALERGSNRWRAALGAGLALAAAALVALQLTSSSLREADLSQGSVEVARDAIRTLEGVRLLDARATFTRPDGDRDAPEMLLVRLAVIHTRGEGAASGVESAVRIAVHAALLAEYPELLPIIEVAALPGLSPPPAR